MISVAAAILLTSLRHTADSFAVLVDQDVWVYPHASDPAGDSALRIWGVGGKAVAADATEAEEFSYGYLRFSFDSVPSDKKLVGATLVVQPMTPTEIGANKGAPLEARPLVGTFLEKSWEYSQIGKVHPSATEIYGTGLVSKQSSGDGVEIRIDLLGKDSKFGEAYAKARTEKQPMYFALTSRFDPSEGGRTSVYKVYSKDNPVSNVIKRPTIELTLQ